MTNQIAETIKIKGNNGEVVDAYYARPSGAGPFPGVVVIHHIFGLDEWCREVARKLADHGYAAITPNLYSRVDAPSAEEQGTIARAGGGVADSQVVGDVDGAAKYLRAQADANGKVGVIGFCSGGRHTYLAAARLGSAVDAAVDCWGGGVIVDDRTTLTEKRPVPVIELTPGLTAPMLGIFGNDDRNPDIDQVNRTEEVLKQHGKAYEFHRYDGAGHGFFATDRANYRAEQATDAWGKVFDFFERNLK